MDISASEDEPLGSRGDQSQALELERFRSHPRPEQVEAHILCDSCTRLITKSRIMQEFMGTAEPEDAYTIWKRLKGGPRTEIFSRSHALSSIADFEASAACHLCSILWHRLPHDAVEHGCGFLDVTVAEDRSVDYVPVTFMVAPSELANAGSDTGGPNHEPWDVRLILKRYRGPLYPAGTSGSGPFLPTSTSSEESLATARCWLNNCLETHSECKLRSVSQAKNVSVKLPTRLIHVGGTEGQLTPRLVLTTSSSTLEDTSYLTLSHSWSITTKETSLKLKTENIQQLQEAIPLEALPQTFRDAMDVTRRLGYQYIWIDSLCIIQNSHEDWEKEAVTMCDVYGNSTCTISALGANGMDRCYVQRNALSLFPCRVSTTEARIPIYATSPHSWDFDYSDKNSPVFQRGWVMQERLLSSRVIFTGHHQFHWECCQFRTNEAFTFAFGSAPIITQSPKLMFHALCDPQYCATDVPGVADPANMSLDSNMLKLYSLWTKLLGDYTHMNLTYQSDKLVALAGILDAIQASRGWTNVAGMWKEFWFLELLWRIDSDHHQRSLTQTELRLPSWSWAATEEPKWFFKAPESSEVMGGVQWDPVKNGGDPARAYSVAQLVDFCGVPPSSQHSRSTTNPIPTLTVKGVVFRGFLKAKALDPSMRDLTIINKWGTHGFFSIEVYRYTFDELPSRSQVVYFLPLIVSQVRGKWRDMDQPCGLILEPVPVDDAGTIKYWPPVPWQSDLAGRDAREDEDGHYRICVGSESYSLDEVLNPSQSIGRGAEPTHYRRIGVFWLNFHSDRPAPEYFFGQNGKIYERTVHIV